jgi:hypothetical protein
MNRIICTIGMVLLTLGSGETTYGVSSAVTNLVAYDNCGVPGLQPHCVTGKPAPKHLWIYNSIGLDRPKGDIFALAPEATWSEAEAVLYRYPWLRRDASYRVRVLFQSSRPIRQSLFANGEPLAVDMEIPGGTPLWKEFDLPPAIAQAGTLDLRIERTGYSAVVSAIELYSDQPLYPHRVAFDDCGNQDRQPHLFVGRSQTVLPERFWEQAPWTSLPHDETLRTINYASPPARAVIYRYDHLRPDARYQVRVTYFSPEASLQAMAVDDTLVHEIISPTPGRPLTITYELEPADYADGQVDVWFFIRNPLTVRVAGIELWSNQPDLADTMPAPPVAEPEVIQLPPLDPSWAPTTDYRQLADGPWRWRGWLLSSFYFDPYGNHYHYVPGGLYWRAAQEMKIQKLITPMWEQPEWMDPNTGAVEEWGYHLNLINGLTKRQCYRSVKRWYLGEKREAEEEGKTRFISMTGQSVLSHYPAKWGSDLIGLEIGTGIQYSQAHVAFGRGAARQYDLPFSVQPSPWRTGLPAYRPDLDEYTPVPTNIPPPDRRRPWNGGRSPSLQERMWYMGWLAGAAFVNPEDGPVNFFAWSDDVMTNRFPVPDNPNERAALSPIGKRAQEFMRMITRHRDIGIPYTPFALYLDEFGGWSNGAPLWMAPWTMLVPTDGDLQVQMFLEVMWPDAKRPGRGQHFDDYEHYLMSRAPYGDALDVLLSDAGNDVLNCYPVLFAMGDHEFLPTTRRRLERYLDGGGRLVLGTHQAAQLDDASWLKRPEVQILDLGKGNTPEGKATLAASLRALADRYLPVTVTGDIQYLINRTADGWVVGLINNEGITKKGIGPVVIDPDKTQNVTLTLKTGRIKTANEWRTEKSLDAADNAVRITVPPGEIRIVEFVIDPEG